MEHEMIISNIISRRDKMKRSNGMGHEISYRI